jgi:hypothetical protein
MAGQPRKRALALELEQRTRLRFEDDEHTMLDYVADWCEGGTLVGLAADIAGGGLDPETDEPRQKHAILGDLKGSQISKLLASKYGSDVVQQRLDASRRIFAGELVETAIEDATNVAADRDAIAKLRVQNDARFWAAERFNRERFGQPKQQGVVINIGSLHIDAMRRRTIAPSSTPQLLAPAEDAIEVTVEGA